MLPNVNLSEIHPLIFISQVFSPAKVIFIAFGVLLSVCTLLIPSCDPSWYDQFLDN
jgi:hypothetical protein